MATAATLYRFVIELSDIDRGVYESLDLRVAQHPSEDLDRLVVRILARAIAHEDALEFGRGISNVEDAALWAHSPMGDVDTWIDVGLPGADRLHRASKLANKLIVFTHKSEVSLRKEWRTRKIHKADKITVYRLPPELVEGLTQTIKRKVTWFVTIQDGLLAVSDGELSVDGNIELVSLASIVSASE